MHVSGCTRPRPAVEDDPGFSCAFTTGCTASPCSTAGASTNLYQAARNARDLPATSRNAACIARLGAAAGAAQARGHGAVSLRQTFTGMPPTDHERDHHRESDLPRLARGSAAQLGGQTPSSSGPLLPETTRGLEDAVPLHSCTWIRHYRSMMDAACCSIRGSGRAAASSSTTSGVPSCPGATAAGGNSARAIRPRSPPPDRPGHVVNFNSTL